MRFFLGGYTADMDGAAEGIGVLHAGAPGDVLAGGDLRLAGIAAAAVSPSWLAWHPTLDVLYAAQEGAGTVRAFARTGEETFRPQGTAVDAGELVCHVAVAPDGSALVASCWGDGRVVTIPLALDGSLGAPRIGPAAVDPHAGAEFDPDPDLPDFSGLALFGDAAAQAAELAQEPGERVSRAHQARFLPGGVVATTDMGFDLVRVWSHAGAALRESSQVVLPRGSGPRHTVWHPSGHLYVVTELSHEVFVVAPGTDGRWRIVGATPVAPGLTTTADSAAEIAVTRDAEFVVVGVRGSDTLATLKVRDGGASLAPVALVESGVDGPRHHTIARDTVLVAGQRSHEVVSLTIDERTGVVGRVRHRVEAPSPTQLLADRG